ncbi:MAG: hypothetical protein HZB26_11990 [Candidatus Hydrogenedentes bacterium]|nr:hypothetical protein [Candidatus Hydrogenedentota bacterium]
MKVPLDYLSGDFSPSFGAERACAEARFLAGRRKPWDLMAWSFLTTDEQGWTTKTVPHLCQELSEVLAQGGATFIYDVPQRSGRLTDWHQDVLAQVAAFCRKRQALCHQTETIPQVAILHSETFFYKNNQPLYNFAWANYPIEGALHAVLENGYSADLLNEEALVARMSAYPIVIVPEQEGLPANVIDALKTYVQNGGHLLVSGANTAQEYPELAGVKIAEGQHDKAYVPADGGSVIVPGPWQNVTLAGATELAPLLKQQDPALDQAGTPAATVNRVGKGVVVAIHGPVFRSYVRAHFPRLRCFIGGALAALDAPAAKVDGPWWIEMSARKKDTRLLIQLVNRSAAGYTAPNRHMVESVPDAGPFSVSIPLAASPKRCYVAPDEAGLEWSWKDGTLTARIGGLAIHNVLVIEP